MWCYFKNSKRFFLSNISKGAKAVNVKLTKKEIKISKLIAKQLKKENLFCRYWFYWSKFNGDINVTSPTGLKTLFDLSKINLAITFGKNLKHEKSYWPTKGSLMAFVAVMFITPDSYS